MATDSPTPVRTLTCVTQHSVMCLKKMSDIVIRLLWGKCHEMCYTFLGLLEYRRWGRGHLHGQPVGSPEGVTVPYDEAAGLPVLQHWDRCTERSADVRWLFGRSFIHFIKLTLAAAGDSPWSLEISGLYQNFDVSCTNLTVTCLPASTSEKTWWFHSEESGGTISDIERPNGHVFICYPGLK